MKALRLIINGTPYKLMKIDKDINVDDYCEWCALKSLCLRNEEELDPRFFCNLGGIVQGSTFVVDNDIDKTIREAMKEEI